MREDSMEVELMAKHIRALEGVTGVSIADTDGRCVASEDATYADGSAVIAPFVMQCSRGVGEAMGLGDCVYVVCAAGNERFSLMGDEHVSVAIEFSSPVDLNAISMDAVGLLAAYR